MHKFLLQLSVAVHVSDAYEYFFHSCAGQDFLLLLMKDAEYKLCAELNKKKKKSLQFKLRDFCVQ